MKRFSAAGTSDIPGCARRYRSHNPAIGVSVGVLLTIVLSLFAALPAAAQGRPPGGNFSDPTIREVDIAQPAVVRVATLYQGTITFNLCGRQDVLPSGGQQVTLGGFGSGAFISANGDILTADHVVDIDKASLDQEMFVALAQQIADLLNANNSCLNLGGVVTADQISYASIHNAGIPFSTYYSAPQFTVWLDSSYTGPATDGLTSSGDFLKALAAAKHMTATLTSYSQFADNDVALLHVDMADTPSIALGNSDTVAVEDHLTIIGFPGNGDASHADATYDTTDLVTPTVNTLTVSSLKTNDNGDTLIQVNGGIEHGDSGGPALDSSGHLMGIVSYSGPDDPINNFFLRASNSAKTLVSTTSISTQPGTFEKLWTQAFLDYASTNSGHWHTASQELDALSTRYPDFQGILPYKKYADQAAQTEVPFGGSSSNFVVISALAIALLALVTLVIVLLVMRQRRKRPQPAVAPAYGSYPYGPYNPYNPYGPYGPYGRANGGAYPPPGYGTVGTPNPYGTGGQGMYRPTVTGVSGPADTAGTPGGPQTPQPQTPAPATVTPRDLREMMSSVPMGQMTSPLVQPTRVGSGAPTPPLAADGGATNGSGEALQGSLANGASASRASNASNYTSSTGAPSAWSPATPQMNAATDPMMRSDGANRFIGENGTTTGMQNTCVNSHAMAPNETYCNVCGMPRATSALSQERTQWSNQ